MNGSQFITWEDAVEWLITQPDQHELVKACYYDRPLLQAAYRFWSSEEWRAVRKLSPRLPGKALDIGAGNGIASFALAKDRWETTALEPDPSQKVGAGAIKALADESGLDILVVQEHGERLPFPNTAFDMIHARQVLHHMTDLKRFCQEVFRVLKPGGTFIATREHVISKQADLQKFFELHPLHRLYGRENAYKLNYYLSTIRSSGIKVDKVLLSFDSVINYAPFTKDSLRNELEKRLSYFGMRWVISSLLDKEYLFKVVLFLMSRLDRRPGRLVSFVCHKPIA